MLVARKLRSNVKTDHNWFKDHYQSSCHGPVPEIERWLYDWGRIQDIVYFTLLRSSMRSCSLLVSSRWSL